MRTPRTSRCSYAETYNRFFELTQTTTGRDTRIARWIASELGDARRTLSHRIRQSRHILKIRHTQRIGVHVDDALLALLSRQERALTLGWIIYHLRPLQHTVRRHIWRPNGPMYARLYAEFKRGVATMEGTRRNVSEQIVA